MLKRMLAVPVFVFFFVELLVVVGLVDYLKRPSFLFYFNKLQSFFSVRQTAATLCAFCG